jgi:hypothetical protein
MTDLSSVMRSHKVYEVTQAVRSHFRQSNPEKYKEGINQDLQVSLFCAAYILYQPIILFLPKMSSEAPLVSIIRLSLRFIRPVVKRRIGHGQAIATVKSVLGGLRQYAPRSHPALLPS